MPAWLISGGLRVGAGARPDVQSDLEADRQVAIILAELITGGSLASVNISAGDGDGGPWAGELSQRASGLR